MIRAATMSDMPRLYEIVEEMYRRSGYAARGIELSPTLLRSRLMEGLRKNGGLHAGSMFTAVAEKKGVVEAFIMGLLQPIYGIGVGLEAIDVFLCASLKAPRIAAGMLIDAYLEWASRNERVKDIYLSWTAIAGVDGGKLAKLYERKGFQRFGEIWKRVGEG